MDPVLPAQRHTGYFGIPGRIGGKVHVIEGKRPMCGIRVDPRAEFQWCAHGIQSDYLECKGCRKKVAPILRERWESTRKAWGFR